MINCLINHNFRSQEGNTYSLLSHGQNYFNSAIEQFCNARVGGVGQSLYPAKILAVRSMYVQYSGTYLHVHVQVCMIRHYVVSSRLHLLPLNSVLNRLIFMIDARKSKLKALSGGMRRRLSVAMTCIGSPDILILDDPTTRLDQEGCSVVSTWEWVGRALFSL